MASNLLLRRPDPEANKPPPPKIYLTGITTFGGVKRALLKFQAPVKPGEEHKPGPPKGEESYILAEGQREGDVEVLEIHDAPGNEYVKVNDFGTVTNLNFEDNGVKVAAAAAAPVPGPHPCPPDLPQICRDSPTLAPPYSPARPMRMPGLPGAAAAPAVAYNGATPVYASGTPGYAGARPPITAAAIRPACVRRHYSHCLPSHRKALLRL